MFGVKAFARPTPTNGFLRKNLKFMSTINEPEVPEFANVASIIPELAVAASTVANLF